MESNDIKHIEERKHYRIDDEIGFNYFIIPESVANWHVTEQEIQERLFTPEEYRHFKLSRELYEIDQEISKATVGLAREQPEVFRCVELLSQKINLLNQNILPTQTHHTQSLNISIGGLAFQSAESIPENARLKVKLLFYPSCIGVVATASVVLNRYLPKKNPQQPYAISGKFLDLTPLDDQIIHRHIMQKEALKLR